MSGFQEDIIARAIEHLALQSTSVGDADLDALAVMFGYESTHFQKIFKEKAGISPKRMVQFMRYSRAREFLLDGYPTLEAAYQAGLSGGGRLHDLFVSVEAATPGMVQRRGEGMVITYGFHETPVGQALIAQSGAGLCWVGFVLDQDQNTAIQKMKNHWPKASFNEDGNATAESASQILRIWRGQGAVDRKIKIDLHGTNFQIQVWRALLKIPAGAVLNYQAVAAALGDPNASRAVGTAVGANPIALLIPCHRVIQKSGIVENYAWGTARKKILLALEGGNPVEDA